MSTYSTARAYQRLLSMDRAEIADRIRQHVRARFDFVRYQTGADFAPEIQRIDSGVHPRFVFAPEAVRQLCAKLREIFPDTARQIVERAERICGHRFDLLGYESLDYGDRIDWHCDRVHGKHAPRKPWYQIRYLDFDEVGDSKVTWELNRHQHLVTLAKAFRLSGNPRFAQEIFLQWEHWHAENPYPIGINWASSLEVALRSLSWLWTYFLLADSPVMPTNFRAAMVRSLGVSGRHIENYLSTYFSPNTHLLGEAVALFFIGTLCPEISSAGRWQNRGWAIIQQQAKRQVRADGLHFERAVYYHLYALDFILHAVVLASANEIAVPKELEGTVELMLDGIAILARDGVIREFGDDDGGRVFDASRNLAAHLTDPLATGAVLFGRGDFKKLARGLREETLWLLGETGIGEFNRIPESEPQRESVALAESGLYVMSGNETSSQLVIGVGSRSAGSDGHGHADAMSITAGSAGRDLLIDSGTLEYVGEDSQRDSFRSTRAHSTLMIDGMDQTEPAGPFAWKSLPHARTELWIAGKSFDLFAGSHDGYTRLPNPVVHRRFVFSLKDEFWLVRDVAVGAGEHQLDIHWHLAPEFAEGVAQNHFVAGDEGLHFATVASSGWKGAAERHWHSPVYGKRDQHWVLHFSTTRLLPAEFVTLMLRSAKPEFALKKFTSLAEQGSPVAGYCYEAERGKHLIFFSNGQKWRLGEWSSDAEFLYVRQSQPDGGPAVIGCNASEVLWGGRPLVTATTTVRQFEITGHEKADLVSSDPQAITVNLGAWKMLVAQRASEDDFKLT